MNNNYTHDIIILGAGIAGSAMALSAARQGFRVALLDKQAPQLPRAETDLRVSSIHLGSEQFLNTLGVVLQNEPHGEFTRIEVWQENSLNEMHFSAAHLGVPYLGRIIENNRLVQCLQTPLQHAHVSCHWPMVLEKVIFADEAVSLYVQGLAPFVAPLIIGADGAHSWLRAQCAIAQDEKAYDHHALVCHVKTQKPHAHTAYQRFLATGPLAFLPLADPYHCSIVWSAPLAHIELLLALDADAFAQQLAHAFMQRLGAVELISPRATFPLVMRHAKQYIAPRAALIGDAIHTVHPLAGQGANLGLMDVKSLANALHFAKVRGRDQGRVSILRRYERERRGANVLMLQAMQFLARDQAPFVQLRALAMQAVEKTPWVKRAIMHHALGLD